MMLDEALARRPGTRTFRPGSPADLTADSPARLRSGGKTVTGDAWSGRPACAVESARRIEDFADV